MSQRDENFQANWDRFTRFYDTVDTLVSERQGVRRWRWLLPDIAFIIPVDDDSVIARCQTWQQALTPLLDYAPQPAERLHITLHYMGDLRQHFWQWRLTTWRRAALQSFVPRIQEALAGVQPFDVTVGPLNAFPAAVFAEVHDKGQLDALRSQIVGALPARAALLHPSRNYLPHITLAYWGKRPVAPLVDALMPYRDADPIRFSVKRVKFTMYSRHVPLTKDILANASEEIVADYQFQG